MNRNRIRRCGWLAGALAWLALYRDSFFVPFLGDSYAYFTTSWGQLPRYFLADVSYPMVARTFYRPLVRCYYFANYLLFEFDYRWYHLANVLLFAAAVVAAARLFRRKTRWWPALLLWFAFAPTHTEPFNWFLAGSADVLVLLFAVLTLHGVEWVAAGRRGWGGIFLAGGSLVLALLSKENAMIIPVLGGIYVIFLTGPACRRRCAPVLVLLAVIAAAYLAFRLVIFDGLGGYSGPAMVGPGDILLNLLHNVWFLTMSPFNISGGLDYGGTAAPIGGLLVMTAGLVYAGKRLRRDRLPAYFWLSFIVSLLPLYRFRITNDMGFGGRYLLLPSFFFCGAMVYLVVGLTPFLPRYRKAMLYFLVGAVLTGAVVCLEMKNLAWQATGQQAQRVETAVKNVFAEAAGDGYRVYVFRYPLRYKGTLLFAPDIRDAVAFWTGIPADLVLGDNLKGFRRGENNRGLVFDENDMPALVTGAALEQYIATAFQESYRRDLTVFLRSPDTPEFTLTLENMREYGDLPFWLEPGDMAGAGAEEQLRFALLKYLNVDPPPPETISALPLQDASFFSLPSCLQDACVVESLAREDELLPLLLTRCRSPEEEAELTYLAGAGVMPYGQPPALRARRLRNLFAVSLRQGRIYPSLPGTVSNPLEYLKYDLYLRAALAASR